MRRLLLSFLLLAGICAAQPRARAFALLGEIPAWFTDQTGLTNADIYGPMNLGEEYRWVVPNIIYAFDESFINYFGERGVQEVEKAIAILNALPSMDTINIDAFPNFSMRVNHRARDLNLLDLKSVALQVLLEQLGLGTPGRFTFTLRIRDPQENTTNYLVIMRNFDPDTWQPTPYVNGQLWTYLSIFDNQDAPDTKASTINEPVDPLILAEPVAHGVPNFAPTLFSFGSYFTGLTRDDVGGLRYIYRSSNRNVETLPADASGIAGLFGGGSGAWTPIPAPSTNDPASTNGTGGFAFYPQGIRGGASKIQFVRGGSGIFYQGAGYLVTNRFDDTVQAVITNGVERTVTQRVTRQIAIPDILFVAEDLSGATDPGGVLRTAVAINNDAINGNAVLDGPGQFEGPSQLSFSKTGPAFLNSSPNNLTQPVGNTSFFIWGSFDGSTNEPFVYPQGTTIRDIEQQVFGGR